MEKNKWRSAELPIKVKKVLLSAKNDWIEQQAREIELGISANNTRKAYIVVKKLTDECFTRMSVIEGRNN